MNDIRFKNFALFWCAKMFFYSIQLFREYPKIYENIIIVTKPYKEFRGEA